VCATSSGRAAGVRGCQWKWASGCGHAAVRVPPHCATPVNTQQKKKENHDGGGQVCAWGCTSTVRARSQARSTLRNSPIDSGNASGQVPLPRSLPCRASQQGPLFVIAVQLIVPGMPRCQERQATEEDG
jgi:hypothetical protein